MAKFTVIRRKLYHVDVEASSAWNAQQVAEELPSRDWQMQEDRVTGVIGLDGAVQSVLPKDEKGPESYGRY